MIFCPYKNIVNFWQTSRIHYLLQMNSIMSFKPMDEKTPKTSPSHWGMWTSSNTPMPGPTPLTTPNGTLNSRIFARHHKVPIAYNSMTHIQQQKCSSHGAIVKINYLPHPWTQPTHHPKRHPDSVNHFSTIHGTNWQTDRLTNGLTDRWAGQQKLNLYQYPPTLY